MRNILYFFPKSFPFILLSNSVTRFLPLYFILMNSKVVANVFSGGISTTPEEKFSFPFSIPRILGIKM